MEKKITEKRENDGKKCKKYMKMETEQKFLVYFVCIFFCFFRERVSRRE
jgi:hypothetical protein